MTSKSSYVARVNQFDAIQFDKDILKILREQLFSTIQSLSPTILARFQPEFELLLQSAVWLGSIGKQFASFGQQLLLICYDKDELTRSRLCLHFLLTVLPKYAKDNAEQRLAGKEWVNTILSWTENTLLILSVVNFFRFLKSGKKPTLIDFLLGLDYITLHSSRRRDVGYSHITRELIWNGFMELLMVMLPLINYKKVQRNVKGFFSKHAEHVSSKSVAPVMDVHTVCAYCEDRPTLPHHIGCGHIFCYYCLEGNVMADQGFLCPLCGASAVKLMRLPVAD